MTEIFFHAECLKVRTGTYFVTKKTPDDDNGVCNFLSVWGEAVDGHSATAVDQLKSGSAPDAVTWQSHGILLH